MPNFIIVASLVWPVAMSQLKPHTHTNKYTSEFRNTPNINLDIDVSTYIIDIDISTSTSTSTRYNVSVDWLLKMRNQ